MAKQISTAILKFNKHEFYQLIAKSDSCNFNNFDTDTCQVEYFIT